MFRRTFNKRARDELAYCRRLLHIPSNEPEIDSKEHEQRFWTSWKRSSVFEVKTLVNSSCLEWRYTYPLLEEAGLETWAFDILGWGFSDLGKLPPCDVASKREHFYEFWRTHIKRPMVLVGPSLGSAVAIDIAVNHPEAVESLVLMDASVYTEARTRSVASIVYILGGKMLLLVL